jgi:3-deoxy-7-phosphoheptulonate synthase
MIVIMKAEAEVEDREAVVREIERLGYMPHPIIGVEHTVVAAVGDEHGKVALLALEGLSGVERVVPILKPYNPTLTPTGTF